MLRLVRLRGSPEAIALGLALGMSVAFTPTIGFQIVIAAALATIFKVSRPAAVAAVWITNPATIPPVYAFTYWVGSLLYAGPSVRKVYGILMGIVGRLGRCDTWEMYGHMEVLVALSRDILVPLWLGAAYWWGRPLERSLTC